MENSVRLFTFNNMSQIANCFLLVRPSHVSFNNDIIETNFFSDSSLRNNKALLESVLLEFDTLVSQLKELEIELIVVDADSARITSSSVFCSEWISTHKNGQVVVYPMLSKNQQLDRNENVLEAIENSGFEISEVVDFTEAETEQVYLESTSSLVLDRVNKVAYASISKHTDEEMFVEFCEDLEFTPIVFSFNDKNGRVVSHTNLALAIGAKFALIASGLIKDKKEKKLVLSQLKSAGKEVVFISEEQVFQFLGNVIQVKNKKGDFLLLLSKTAYGSLTNDQKLKLEKHGKLICVNLNLIEKILGGSVKKMMLEIFLEKK